MPNLFGKGTLKVYAYTVVKDSEEWLSCEKKYILNKVLNVKSFWWCCLWKSKKEHSFSVKSSDLLQTISQLINYNHSRTRSSFNCNLCAKSSNDKRCNEQSKWKTSQLIDPVSSTAMMNTMMMMNVEQQPNSIKSWLIA